MSDILAFDPERTENCDLIFDCHLLGYLRPEWDTLDPTYGYGNFWTRWRPDVLHRHDLNPAKAPDGVMDFTALLYDDRSVMATVFDPPYKLNGTSRHPSDEAYGVDAGWDKLPVKEKVRIICAGAVECARVTERMLLVKCKDQVVSGHVVWQTHLITELLAKGGFRLEDRLDVVSYIAQPKGRSQRHARRNTSQLLVFERTN